MLEFDIGVGTLDCMYLNSLKRNVISFRFPEATNKMLAIRIYIFFSVSLLNYNYVRGILVFICLFSCNYNFNWRQL